MPKMPKKAEPNAPSLIPRKPKGVRYDWEIKPYPPLKSVLFQLKGFNTAVFPFTPRQAREIAARLIEVADEVDKL